MKCLVIILLFVSINLKAQRSQRFEFMNPFRTCYHASEDIGLSVQWRTGKPNTIGVGTYYSIQTSPLGAGIWYHLSGFSNVMLTPSAQEMAADIGVNVGVSLLLLEVKIEQRFTKEHIAFIPAAGIGINRLAYVMADYIIQPGKNSWNARLVFRIPLFTRVDKGVSITPNWE